MDDQRDVIDFLARGGAHQEAHAIERIETPTSLVFLGGTEAIKLKRAITLPFLDQATVEQRRVACEAELRLNRRTAPELYRDVVAIVRDDRGVVRLGRKDEPAGMAVDWVVRMRRFDQAGLFDRMADEGRLTPDLLRGLADRIAAFHAGAEVAPGHGGARAIRNLIALVRDSMRGLEAILPACRAEAWSARALMALHRLGPRLDARRAVGHVRRGHGDLHLRNICLVDGRPTLFDCIEFSDAIACTDTLHDLAFLLMDLWQRGLRSEANLVFNRYADMSGDECGHGLLPFFMSLRAAVRAHVCAHVAIMGGNAREAAQARIYFETAFACLDRHPPRLLAIGGLSGTGKSTLAYALAPALGEPPGARVLRSDVIRKRMHGLVPEQRLPESAYAAEMTASVYALIGARAAAAIRDGHSAIADAVFARAEERAAIAAAADDFTGLWLEAAPEILRDRVAGRRNDASDADVAVLDAQLARPAIDPGSWRRIDAGQGLAAMLAEIRGLPGLA